MFLTVCLTLVLPFLLFVPFVAFVRRRAGHLASATI